MNGQDGRRDLRRRLHDERGAGVLVIIGVIAALAVMGATLAVLLSNVQHNTYNENMQVKSSNVAEAALDVGMANLAGNWPSDSAAGTALDWAATTLTNATDSTEFRAMFSTSDFPNPDATHGTFSAVTYEDDVTTTPKPNYDSNGNDKMYVVAQAGVGPKATRIKTLVQLNFFEMGLPRGIALFTGGNLLSNGGGNNPKILVDPSSPPPDGTQASIRVSGTIDDATVADQSKYAELTGSSAGSADDVFPAALVDQIRLMAQQHGRYFTSVSAAESSGAVPGWSDGGLSGLTVIEPSSLDTVSLSGTLNSVAEPGILLVLGGSNIDFGGGGDFYGVMYTAGTVDKGHGSFIVHGMLVAVSTVDMRGTVNISYNDACITNLNTRWASNVRVVPNTWRELTPVY